jgi:hypothetical protein
MTIKQPPLYPHKPATPPQNVTPRSSFYPLLLCGLCCSCLTAWVRPSPAATLRTAPTPPRTGPPRGFTPWPSSPPSAPPQRTPGTSCAIYRPSSPPLALLVNPRLWQAAISLGFLPFSWLRRCRRNHTEGRVDGRLCGGAWAPPGGSSCAGSLSPTRPLTAGTWLTRNGTAAQPDAG